MKKPTILIIDDDPDIVAGIRAMLEAKGYRVLAADDYAPGLAKVREARPDLIILDAMLKLGDNSGLQLPAEIRKDPAIAHIPVLMITAINDGLTGEELVSEMENEKLLIDGFIDKPARQENLYKQVDRLLEQKTSKWAKKFS